MNIRCENCGRAALDTDSTCWHCGEALPGRQDAGRVQHKASESWSRGTGPASIAVYGALTLLVILGAVLVMAWLGRQPQLQVRMGTFAPSGWAFITGADRAFTLSLPENWSWLEGAGLESAAELQKLVDEQPHLRLATHPLGAEVDDMTILFAAGSPLPGQGQTPILVIASSPLLNRLTYREAQDFLANSDYQIRQISFVDDFDKSHLSIIVDTPLESETQGDRTGETMRCRQQFVLGRQQSLLISLCRPPGGQGALTQTFDQIMASFQHLDT